MECIFVIVINIGIVMILPNLTFVKLLNLLSHVHSKVLLINYGLLNEYVIGVLLNY